MTNLAVGDIVFGVLAFGFLALMVLALRKVLGGKKSNELPESAEDASPLLDAPEAE